MNQVLELIVQICDNDATADGFHNLIGPVSQSNDANGAGNSVVTQSNIIDVTQNLQGTNDCDEANTGDNNAQCSTEIFNNIDSITQTNVSSHLLPVPTLKTSPTYLPLRRTW